MSFIDQLIDHSLISAGVRGCLILQSFPEILPSFLCRMHIRTESKEMPSPVPEVLNL